MPKMETTGVARKYLNLHGKAEPFRTSLRQSRKEIDLFTNRYSFFL